MRGLDLRFKIGEVGVHEDAELLLCLRRPLELALVSEGGSSGRLKIGEATHACARASPCTSIGTTGDRKPSGAQGSALARAVDALESAGGAQVCGALFAVETALSSIACKAVGVRVAPPRILALTSFP